MSEQAVNPVPDRPVCHPVAGRYPLVFVLLLACWLVMMLWPCLTQTSLYVSHADNAVMTLMAAVILAALRMALLARERVHATLFAGAELLYCSAY